MISEGSGQWAVGKGEEENKMGCQNYKDLIAWQKAMDLVEDIYRLSGKFPREEIYGLTSQIRRAVVSVPSNIAEGQGRISTMNSHDFSILHTARCVKSKHRLQLPFDSSTSVRRIQKPSNRSVMRRAELSTAC